MTSGPPPWPTEIRLQRASNRLHIRFDDGTAATLAAATLRRCSPAADTRGHGGARGVEQDVAGADHVAIVTIEPVGSYAVRLVFDDGHRAGIYGWPLLHRLAREQGRLSG